MRALAVKLGLLALMFSAVSFMPSAASAQVRVGVAITLAPPILPVYDQPICPGDGYMWTPGYWGWGDDGYFWVPGTWVLAPEPGFLWTPGYWGWGDGSYVWYDGYWGPTVGFYGGIGYGFGYFGVGFVGGRWDHGHFFYNTAVMHVNETVIHNTYNERVTNETITHTSYNGPGGIDRRPNAAEEAASRERHLPPSHDQVEHVTQARSNPALRDSENHGHPSIAATAKPGEFTGRDAVGTRDAGGAERADRPATSSAVHAKDLPPIERPAAPNTGNAKLDKKYTQEQNKVIAQQQKDRQKLTQQQDKEDQRLTKQHADQASTQAQEQRHQQQTQQMVQRHTQQTQSMTSRQSAPAGRR